MDDYKDPSLIKLPAVFGRTVEICVNYYGDAGNAESCLRQWYTSKVSKLSDGKGRPTLCDTVIYRYRLVSAITSHIIGLITTTRWRQ